MMRTHSGVGGSRSPGILTFLWPLLPIAIMFMIITMEIKRRTGDIPSSAVVSLADSAAKDASLLDQRDHPRKLSDDRLISSLLGPYYKGNLPTVRRRWLDSSIRVDQPLLASPVYPRDIQPDAVEVYGSLAAGGAEDTEKVAKHLKAWDTLLSNVKKGKGKPKVAIATTTYENLEVIRNWIGYHMSLGIGTFYLYLDGRLASDDAVSRLNHWIPKANVKLIPRTLEFRDASAGLRTWNESWLAPFFHLPCNSDLFVKQNLNLMFAVDAAQKDDIDWLLHIDTDELLYPGPEYNNSMQDLLNAVPEKWKYIEFANYEALPERTDVRDPFTEVTLIKRSHLHTEAGKHRKCQAIVRAKNLQGYTMAYANGKSAARVRPGLRPNGAHKFSNYRAALDKKRMAEEYWIPHPTAYLVHYVYSKFHDVESRRDRCDCLPTEEDAPRCFMLGFDREAFIAASTLPEPKLREWYRQRIVWDDAKAVASLLEPQGCFFYSDFFANRMKQIEAIFKEHS